MIEVRIYTPEGEYKTVPGAKIINADTTDGWRGILPGHMPIVLILRIGKIIIDTGTARDTYTVAGGMLYFEDNVATVLTDAIENVRDIDVSRAQAAKERAERRLAEKGTDLDVSRAELALAKALNRIRAAQP